MESRASAFVSVDYGLGRRGVPTRSLHNVDLLFPQFKAEPHPPLDRHRALEACMPQVVTMRPFVIGRHATSSLTVQHAFDLVLSLDSTRQDSS